MPETWSSRWRPSHVGRICFPIEFIVREAKYLEICRAQHAPTQWRRVHATTPLTQLNTFKWGGLEKSSKKGQEGVITRKKNKESVLSQTRAVFYFMAIKSVFSISQNIIPLTCTRPRGGQVAGCTLSSLHTLANGRAGGVVADWSASNPSD